MYRDLRDHNSLSNQEKLDYFGNRAILAPLNAEVDEINEACLNQLPAEGKTYASADTAIDELGTPNPAYPPEYLNGLNFPSMPPHVVQLKVGCPIISLRNLDPASGLCNGMHLIVTVLQERVIEAKILSGRHAGKAVFIPRILLITPPTSGFPFRL